MALPLRLPLFFRVEKRGSLRRCGRRAAGTQEGGCLGTRAPYADETTKGMIFALRGCVSDRGKACSTCGRSGANSG